VEKISKYQSFTFGFIRFLHRLRGDYKDLWVFNEVMVRR
jgi:hypothetical protein